MTKKIIILNLVILFFFYLNANSQNSGLVDYEYLGIEFKVPDGWVGQKGEEGYVMGSNTVAGMITVFFHDYTDLQSLEAEISQGITDEGMQLTVENQFERIGDNAIGGTLVGQIQGSAVKAYSLTVVNKLGKGLMMIAVTSPEMYNSSYKDILLEIKKSAKFKKPKENPLVTECLKQISGRRLLYIYTGSTGSYDYDEGYYNGVYSNEEVKIDLCANKTFRYSGNSSTSITGGAIGYSGSNDNGDGEWKVNATSANGIELSLMFNNGTVKSFKITSEENWRKIYLNGERYYYDKIQGCF